jgi:iron complex transport system substrate-binding protein
LKKITTVLVLVFMLIIPASAYGTYVVLHSGIPAPSSSPSPTLTPPPSSSPSPSSTSTPSPSSVTVMDGRNESITIDLPVERIISLNSGLTEIFVAMGCQDILIGRDESSTLPPSVLSVPVVGANAYVPNVELIIEMEPDVVFADSMLAYNDVAMQQLIDAGITLFITDSSSPEAAELEELTPSTPTPVDFTCELMQTLSLIVGHEDVVEEFTEYVQYYNNLVRNRLATLTRDQKPVVFLEWYKRYYSFQTPNIYQAGGINIAENITLYAPQLNAEFVVEQNPDVIIRLISSQEHREKDFIEMKTEILSRTELADVAAVKNGRVYICDYAFRGGIHCIAGYVAWAKWCQPDLFDDIDPDAIFQEVNEKFFGTTIEGVFKYP